MTPYVSETNKAIIYFDFKSFIDVLTLVVDARIACILQLSGEMYTKDFSCDAIKFKANKIVEYTY